MDTLDSEHTHRTPRPAAPGGEPGGPGADAPEPPGGKAAGAARAAGKALLWAFSAPLALMAVLSVLLYLPPVQRWAVDHASRWLSEATGMEVSVGSVRLKCPLDLAMGDMLAVQRGDTVACARTLDVSVRLLPLLRGELEVDRADLLSARLNSLQLIDAAHISGQVGQLSLSAHSVDWTRETAVVSHLLLKDASVEVALAGSVPEDTAPSAPCNWKILLPSVHVENVRARVLLSPRAGRTFADVTLGRASLQGELDLGKERYSLRNVRLDRSACAYGKPGRQAAPGTFDAGRIEVSDLAADIPQAAYDGRTGQASVEVAGLSGRERCGLSLREGRGTVEMDSASLAVPKFRVATPASELTLSYRMDLSAFDDPAAGSPGTFSAEAEGRLGKDDVAPFVAACLPGFAQAWPSQPTDVTLKAHGNLRRIVVDRARAAMGGAFELEAWAAVLNPTDTLGGMELRTAARARLHDADFAKGFLPEESRGALTIPHGTDLQAGLTMREGRISAEATVAVGDGRVELEGEYGLGSGDYTLAASAQRLRVHEFVPSATPVCATASVTAEGRGLDFLAPATTARAEVAMDSVRVGDIDLSHSRASLALEGGVLTCGMDCDNPQLRTRFTLDGKVQTGAIDAHIDLDLRHIDLRAMGVGGAPLEASTRGDFTVKSDLDRQFRVGAKVDRVNLLIGEHRISTDTFDLFAETTADTTAATISSGDLRFDFHAPDNLLSMADKAGRLADAATRQVSRHELNIHSLKQYLPEATLRMRAGTSNPLLGLLGIYGLSFREVRADLASAPATGLTGNAHVYGLRADSVTADYVFLSMAQDSAYMVFRSGVTCGDQKAFPGFTAYLNGKVSAGEADARFTFFDKQLEKGVDLGFHALAGDTALSISLYPSEPILGFRRFKLNDNNFVRLERQNRVFADVRLTSMEDSCGIAVTARPEGGLLQNVSVLVRHLDVGRLASVVPGMPRMEGLLNIDASYEQDAGHCRVRGTTGIDRFAYEGTPVGDVRADFEYTPLGGDTHQVRASVFHDSRDVLDVDGTYNAAGSGSLDARVALADLPLGMAAPFIPDQAVTLGGTLSGTLSVRGPAGKPDIDGELLPHGATAHSDMYSVALRFADQPVAIANSRATFSRHEIYGAGDNPLTLTGWVDFADTDNVDMSLSLYGRNFKLIDAPRTRKSVVFGSMYGDFFARVSGTPDNLKVRGLVSVLGNTDMTYVMADTPLSVDYRLEDIVTFVDFTAPPDTTAARARATFLGMDMQMGLMVEDGAQFHCEFSADRQNYVDVQGGGSLNMTYTPEGVLTLQGRYVVNEGEMKYTLPVIPLKTFAIAGGSYVEFTGDPANPSLSIAASEEVKATVSSGGASRSVTFNTGLKVAGTLENMELLFTIDAPEDLSVQNELAGMPKEEKNKLAVGMLCTGMYLASSNSSGVTANNALNNFLQNEINNIAGQALSTAVDVNVGMEQSTRDDGSTRTDYAFKFSKRFFSNRLNVVIGGKVNADGSTVQNESGAYIDNVSLEWRLDSGGTRYVRLYHEKNYDNLLEGELIENGGSVVLRRKFDRLSDLIIWKKKDGQ